jgi:hypothetical protein
MERTISMMLGDGSLNHNNRKFTAKNVDGKRSRYNVVFVKQNIREVYHELFDAAQEAYNTRQKRKDRRIPDYYKKVKNSSNVKTFWELIVQIGNKDDTNCSMEESRQVKRVLEEYMEEFQTRNPQLRVFNAVMHMDEATPHLHIDFVPFAGGYTNGMKTQCSMKGAMKAQGFVGKSKSDTENARWVAHEKEQLAKIMEKHHIFHLDKGTHEKHLSVYDYEKKMRKAEVEELERQVADSKTALEQRSAELNSCRKQIDSRKQCLRDYEDKIREKREDLEKIMTEGEDKKQEIREWCDVLTKRGEFAKKRCDLYNSLITDKKKEYEELRDKTIPLSEQVTDLQSRIETLKTDKEEREREVTTESLKLKIIEAEVQKAADNYDKAQKKTEELVEAAQEQFDRYCVVAPDERSRQIFEDMIVLKQENMDLKEENRTLREKLRQAYDFMKQYTINGINQLERFKEYIGEKVQDFVESMGRSR